MGRENNRKLGKWKKTVENNYFEASMKTAIKNVEKAVLNKDKEKASETLKVAIKRIDKAVSKGILHKNTAARKKSRLVLAIKKLAK